MMAAAWAVGSGAGVGGYDDMSKLDTETGNHHPAAE
jgi:hypothetical protein